MVTLYKTTSQTPVWPVVCLSEAIYQGSSILRLGKCTVCKQTVRHGGHVWPWVKADDFLRHVGHIFQSRADQCCIAVIVIP